MSNKTWTIVFTCIMVTVILGSVIYFLVLERKETKFVNTVAEEIVKITDADFNRTMTRLNEMNIELDKINKDLDLLIEFAYVATKTIDEIEARLDDLEIRYAEIQD